MKLRSAAGGSADVSAPAIVANSRTRAAIVSPKNRPVTRNVSVVKFNSHAVTPFSRSTPVCTVVAQLAQSMPVTRKVVVWSLITVAPQITFHDAQYTPSTRLQGQAIGRFAQKTDSSCSGAKQACIDKCVGAGNGQQIPLLAARWFNRGCIMN